MISAPPRSKVRSYGESSRESHSWSHRPSGEMRYTAPFGERRSSRGDEDDPALVSTIDIEVISADTDAIGARTTSPPVIRSGPLSVTIGAAPDPCRPLSAAT